MSDQPTIYFDAEFSDLSANARLISIGFAVDPDWPSKDLYIELTDGWNKKEVSYFVEEAVLPLLGRFYPELLRRSPAAARIEEWLDELRGGDKTVQIELVSDSEWDWAMVNSLFKPGWPKDFNVGFRMRPYTELQEILISEYLEKNDLERDRHHALIDARALCYAATKIAEIMANEEIE